MLSFRTAGYGAGRSGAPAAVAQAFAAERDRWALWLPAVLGLGVGLYFALPAEPAGWVGPLSAGLGALAAAAGRRRTGPFLLAVVFAVAAAGFSLAQLRTARVAAPVLEKRVGPVTVLGRVARAQRHGEGYRLVLDDVAIGRRSLRSRPERVRLKVRAVPPDLRPGDAIAVRAVVAPPPEPAAPGAFDFARRAYFAGIGGVGFAVGRVRLTERAAAWSPGIAVARLRQHLTGRILAGLDPPAGGIAAALMTGERGSIPDDVLAAMRDSGLAHLLAISGLHIGLVAGLLFFGLRLGFAAMEPLALRHPVKKWAALGAMAGAFGYLLLSGATVPTQRAFVMVSVVLIAVLLDRTAISMRLVAWAAAAVLLIAPESLLSASFQLSFAAVIALIAVYEAVSGPLSAWRGDGGLRRRLPVYLAGLVLTTVVAGLATAPFAVYHFNRLALYGVAANALAVPLTGFWIMPWAVAALLLMPFGLEGLALAPMGWGIDAVIAVARTVAGWPGSVALLPAMPTFGLGAVALGGLWLCLWRTRWRLLGLGAVAGGLATLPFVRMPDVLIDGSARLMAVRAADGGLALSSRSVARFEGELWLRRAGLASPVAWDAPSAAPGRRLACDGLGCIYRAGGQTLAWVRHPAALAEDCFRATVVVSSVPVRRRACRAPLHVIDRFDIWRHGAHAIWLGADGVRIESVNQRRGDRPWTRRRGRRLSRSGTGRRAGPGP